MSENKIECLPFDFNYPPISIDWFLRRLCASMGVPAYVIYPPKTTALIVRPKAEIVVYRP
jgi:hypothetical protein